MSIEMSHIDYGASSYKEFAESPEFEKQRNAYDDDIVIPAIEKIINRTIGNYNDSNSGNYLQVLPESKIYDCALDLRNFILNALNETCDIEIPYSFTRNDILYIDEYSYTPPIELLAAAEEAVLWYIDTYENTDMITTMQSYIAAETIKETLAKGILSMYSKKEAF